MPFIAVQYAHSRRNPSKVAAALCAERRKLFAPGQVAGYGEVARRAGLPGRARLAARVLAGNDDPECFADAVLTLLANPYLRTELGANARRAAEDEYDWMTLTAKLEQFYERVLERALG